MHLVRLKSLGQTYVTKVIKNVADHVNIKKFKPYEMFFYIFDFFFS